MVKAFTMMRNMRNNMITEFNHVSRFKGNAYFFGFIGQLIIVLKQLDIFIIYG
jgi:hypothetical protein